jgi:hypothetical protein
MTIHEALKNPNPCAGGAACTCGPGKYFVSCIDGDEYYLMAGPYATHQEAQRLRRKAQDIAESHDPRAFWMAWGVCVLPDDTTRIGVLNKFNLI